MRCETMSENNPPKRDKKAKKKNALTQPHDVTFKDLFSKKEIAKDVIMQNLPKEILEDMDFNSLEQLDGSFINEKLEETFSDIIYGVNIKGREAYIALLLEHKSYKDKLTIFQVSRYIIDLWSKVIKGGKKELPVVIPIVVYHGQGKWNYKKDTRDLIPGYDTLPEYIKERLPVLKHDFINITGHNESDIKQYKPLTRMVIRAFKYIFDDTDTLIEALLVSIYEAEDKVPDEELSKVLETMFIYFLATNKELTEDDILRKIKELDGKGDKIMTILQARETKGIEQGIERGLELGRAEKAKESARNGIIKGYSMEIIMDLTGLTEEEIEEVRREMLKSN